MKDSAYGGPLKLPKCAVNIVDTKNKTEKQRQEEEKKKEEKKYIRIQICRKSRKIIKIKINNNKKKNNEN